VGQMQTYTFNFDDHDSILHGLRLGFILAREFPACGLQGYTRSMRRVLLGLILCGVPAIGQVEMHLTFPFLEKVIAEQAFTEDGRRYVKGAKGNKCSFAYLEKPRIGEANGQLEVRAKFSGRSAMNVLGQCVGLGDSFGVVILMTPYAEKSVLKVREVEVTSDGRRGVYARSVCRALAESIPKMLVRDLGPDFKRVLESPVESFPFARAVDEVSVSEITVSPKDVVLRCEWWFGGRQKKGRSARSAPA
jgi:hypothetical protein